MKIYNEMYERIRKELEELHKVLKEHYVECDEYKVERDRIQHQLDISVSNFKKLKKEIASMLCRPKKHLIIERFSAILSLVMIFIGYLILGDKVIAPFFSKITSGFLNVLASGGYFVLGFVIVVVCGAIGMMISESLNNKWKAKIMKTSEYEEIDSLKKEEYNQLKRLHEKRNELDDKIDKSNSEIDNIENKIRELKSFMSYLENLMKPDVKEKENNKTLVRKKTECNNGDNN